MHIITTIYFADVRDMTETSRGAELAESPDGTPVERQWVSIYEGKNRVEPIDHND